MAPTKNQPEKQAKNRSKARLDNGQFAPGHSGNPDGRPPSGDSLAELIRTELDQPAKRGSKRSKRKMLARMVVDRALAGDWRFVKMIVEKIEPVSPSLSDEDAEGANIEDGLWGLEYAARSPHLPFNMCERSRKLLDAVKEFFEAAPEDHECEDYLPQPLKIRSRLADGRVSIQFPSERLTRMNDAMGFVTIRQDAIPPNLEQPRQE